MSQIFGLAALIQGMVENTKDVDAGPGKVLHRIRPQFHDGRETLFKPSEGNTVELVTTVFKLPLSEVKK